MPLSIIGALAALAFLTSAHLESEPANSGLVVSHRNESETSLSYDGKVLFVGRCYPVGHPEAWKSIHVDSRQEVGARGEITQEVVFESSTGGQVLLEGNLSASGQAFPAETRTPATERFKMVRNAIGLSANTRNNAIYDRRRDWMLEGGKSDLTLITPLKDSTSARQFRWTSFGARVHLTFRPRFYQKHKNIAYFKPWTYDVWHGSVTGWCSWWAYFSDVHEKDIEKVSRIFATKLKNFGYRYIQIDDGYQAGSGGLPKDWLNTNDRFPSGLEHLNKSISGLGLEPALWLNVHFGDQEFVDSHKDWFIQDPDGKPHKGPWIDFGLDGSVKAATDAIVRPIYSSLHKMGWRYIKVDALRHLLYDSSYPSRAYFAKKGITAEEAYRDYLKVIRSEIGPDTYMLACWGVLPEVVGIANGCRLGGDGFGPSTLQQYTSWNNVVWRNDPDHCDIKPLDRATGKYVDGEEIIRPVLVSMAGAQLLLSDKPEVYEDDANLEGIKRSSPVLFTLPGQLYDYDPTKTDHLKQGLRNETGGANSGPIDADQRGEVCPWWMLDINEPYESWSVLSRMNWHKGPMSQSPVQFSDLGLAPASYSVFEFWSKRYLGDFTKTFMAKSLAPKEVATYSIRKTVDRPQILSTSRHISQGAAEVNDVTWGGANTLSGSSNVVKGDAYSIYIRVPDGFNLKTASFGGKKAEVRVEGRLAEIKFTPLKTGETHWMAQF